MLNELLSLGEIIRSLAQRRNELDKEYFENFIEPIWKSFSSIHNDYKEAFSRYQNSVWQDKSLDIVNKMIETITRDSALTSDLRSELRSLISNLPSAKMKVKVILLSNFTKSILDYFYCYDEKDVYYLTLLNVRYSILAELKDISHLPAFDSSFDLQSYLDTDFEPRHSAYLTKIIDDSIEHIQSHYKNVSDAYYRLRKELLT